MTLQNTKTCAKTEPRAFTGDHEPLLNTKAQVQSCEAECPQASGYPSWGQAELSVTVCHPGYLYRGLRLARLSNLAHGETDPLQQKSEILSRTVNS